MHQLSLDRHLLPVSYFLNSTYFLTPWRPWQAPRINPQRCSRSRPLNWATLTASDNWQPRWKVTKEKLRLVSG